MHHIIKILPLFMLIFSLVLAPITPHASPFTEMTLEEEYVIGQQFNLFMKTQAPIAYDPLIKDYLQDILEELFVYVHNKDYQYEINLLIDPGLNAFAAPAGNLFVHSGLFLRMENESELASVIAHEIAHVSQRHHAKNSAKAAKISMATLAASLASVFSGSADVAGAVLTSSVAAGHTALLSYSRTDENEADSVGFEYTVKAGYDPMGYVTSFQKLQSQVGYNPNFPTYLSTHPALDERISVMNSRIRSQFKEIKPTKTDNTNFLFVQKFIRASFEDVKSAKNILVKQNKNLAEDYLALGLIAKRELKIDEARMYYDKLLNDVNSSNFLKKYSRTQRAFFLREIAYFHYTYGDITKANELVNTSLSMNDSDLMAHFYQGRIYDSLKGEKSSISHYQHILDVYPYDSQVHNLIGQAYGKNNSLMLGYLHLAYAKLYVNQVPQARELIKKSTEYAKSKEEKELIKKFNEDAKEFQKVFS